MRENYNTKFGIVVDRHSKGMWSLGAGISSFGKEKYVYINLFKWSVSIGFLYEYEEAFFLDSML